MKRRILIIPIFFILLMVFTEIMVFTDCSKVVRERTTKVYAKVINKNFIAGTNRVICVGKTFAPVIIPPQYNIHLQYGEIKKVVNDANIYKNVEIGDEITMILVQGYSQNDELIKEKLEFIKEE